MKEALYYEKAANDAVRCLLCPRRCLIRPGKAGICRVRQNVGGRLIATSYERISSMMLDPIEKKPLYHFYPGSYILSVGSTGCNFRCQFCQNWSIAQQDAPTRRVSSDELVCIGSNGGSIGIAYTYNEPLIWHEYVLECAQKARTRGLKNVLVTNGFIEEQPLMELLPYIDAMNIDLKSFRSDYYRKICKGEINAVLRTIQRAAANTHVEVTTLIVTGLNDSDDEISELSQWLASVDKDIPIHLSRYFPNYKMTLPPTPIETLQRLKNVADKNLSYVYIGNITGIDDNTYCPRCGKLLIRRDIIPMVTGMKDGCCIQCGLKIKGVFEEEDRWT